MRKNHVLVLAWLILGTSHSVQADLTAKSAVSTGQGFPSSGGNLYQRHVDGKIWVWDGQSKCTADRWCPGWTLIDKNERTKDIAAGEGIYFKFKTLELRPVEEPITERSERGRSTGFCISRGNEIWSSFSPGPDQMMVGFDNLFAPGTDPFPCDDIRASVFRGGVRFDLSMFDNILVARLQFDTQRSISRSGRGAELISRSPPISHATILGVATEAFSSSKMPFDNDVTLPTTSFIDVNVSGQVRDWVNGSRVNFGFVVAGPAEPYSLLKNNDARLSFYGNFRLLVTYNPMQNPRAPQ